MLISRIIFRTSLVVQWLRLPSSNAGGMCWIPGWGSKIPPAALSKKKFFLIKIIMHWFLEQT